MVNDIGFTGEFNMYCPNCGHDVDPDDFEIMDWIGDNAASVIAAVVLVVGIIGVAVIHDIFWG